MEVYAWGTGTYGRLGLGNSNDAQVPQRVGGVLNGCDVTCTSCGWYHSGVVTSAGEVATFGSRVTKCLGTAASGSEASDASGASGEEGSSGEDFRSRAAPAGEEGRRRGAGDQSHCTANFVPHILRSFPSRVTVVQVAIGSDMLGAHTLAVTRTGRLYGWGYGPACGLGSTKNVSAPTLVAKFLGTGAGEHGSGRGQAAEMEPLGWGRHSHHRYRQRSSNRHLGLQLLKPRIVKAVCGGGFSAVMSSEGEVFTFGLSASGRLGFRTKFRAQLRPRRIETLSEGTLDLAAGAGFVLLCSAAGRLLAWGDNSKGQLGIGHLQESHEPIALGRVCPAAFVMQAVAAGDSHSLALDSSGRTYSWGGEGGPMTGQGQPLSNALQVDAAFQFRLGQLHHWWVRPALVRALLGIRVVHIVAGCLHSVALAQDGTLFAWGATLQAGNAEAVGPEVAWMPRLLAPSPKLPLLRVGTVAAGGWHSLATAAPSCPIERLPPYSGEDRSLQTFCDGFLVSEADSRPGEEARVYLCCAAVRARLALPDGTDSPVWSAFAAQVQRLQQDVGRSDLVEEAGSHRSSSSSDDGLGLMDIVALHRQHPRPPSYLGRGARFRNATGRLGTSAQAPGHTSDADEAAGKAIHEIPTDKNLAQKPYPKPLARSFATALKAPIVFSSDSSSSDAEPTLQRAQQGDRCEAGQPQPVPIFSSDSSSSDERPVKQAMRFSSPLQQEAPQPPTPSGAASLELCKFSEAILTALVRFLNTDSLGSLEVIDEKHPVWQREQRLRLQSPRTVEAGEALEEEAVMERPTLQRAVRCLLLRREVLDLRRVGSTLGLERLACLCDQLLLRLDAPEAPALFVPASTLRNAMWTLLQQTRDAPLRDGPDTRILCAPPMRRRARWGPRNIPPDGKLLAHSFVLYAGCSNVHLESISEEGDSRGRQRSPSGVEWQTACYLKGCGLGSAVSFELALGDVPADIALAWLRYLYTQDDLSLLWPCRGKTPEAAIEAEKFWTELLRLAQRVGDRKLQLYAQDTLVGALSLENWARVAIFADQVQCHVLSEAALMTGVRLLNPTLLVSFCVPTGFERDDSAKSAEKEEPAAGVTEQSPTIAQTWPGRSGGAARGNVDQKLEQHLLELCKGTASTESAAILTLKKGSPAQYAELKHRLADTIVTAQRTGEQLQRCIHFFDSHERRGFRRDEKLGRGLWLELVVLAVCLCFFMIPSIARQHVLGFAAKVVEPFNVALSLPEISWLAPLTSGMLRAVGINVLMLLVLCAVIWTGLKA